MLVIQSIKCIVYFLIGKSKKAKAFFDGIKDAKCYIESAVGTAAVCQRVPQKVEREGELTLKRDKGY